MKIAFAEICRDYLALRGESPDLLPLLEEGEDSAVLTLADELRVRLPEEAARATEATPRKWHDELRTATVKPAIDRGGFLKLRLPADYMMLYSLRMEDWREALTEVEPVDSIRWALGADAPDWMYCTCRPMVKEERDSEGPYLKVYGSGSDNPPAELLYVPRPVFDGATLTISRASYSLMLANLAK